MLWLCLPFAALLSVYCVQEAKERFVPATVLKVLLSGLIAVLAWVYVLCGTPTPALCLMAAGLTCAVPADYFLQYIKTDGKKYDAGILCFALMHMCLLFSYVDRYGIHWQEFVLFACLLLFLLILQTAQKWNLGAQQVPLSIYTLLVVMMAAKSVTSGFMYPGRQAALAALGGACFLMSDAFLGVWSYHDHRKVFMLLNRVIYFSGQLLFAFSLGC